MYRYYLNGEKHVINRASKMEELFSVFEPYPLSKKEEFDNFFVKTYDARGTNIVKLMSYGMELSHNPYMKILVMGHRGSGKSTELSILQNELKNKFEIISFFIQEEVDTENMTYIDFVFAIMSRIIKFIDNKNETGELFLDKSDIDALYDYWFSEKILEETEFDYGEIKTGFSAKLSFLKKIIISGGGIFKTGSESKVSIRRKIEPKTGYLVTLINQIIKKVNKKLETRELLFIIEDLDKISIDTAENLFIKHRKTWLSLETRIILTFPIFMAYNLQYNMIKEDIDLSCMLSMIKVKNQNKGENTQGINIIKEIVYKRAEKNLFDDNALGFLINKSGGALRDLFQMIRDASFEALLKGHMKITQEDATVAYCKLKSENERLIRSENEIKKLVEIYNNPRLLTTDDTVMELLLKGLVLEYNGERWCGLHPAVEDFLTEKGKIKKEQKSV